MGVTVSTIALPDLVKLLKEEAPALRKAGVLKLTYADVIVELASDDGPVEQQSRDIEIDEDPEDPLDDPRTYGLPPGAEVPGFKALREKRRSDRET